MRIARRLHLLEKRRRAEAPAAPRITVIEVCHYGLDGALLATERHQLRNHVSKA